MSSKIPWTRLFADKWILDLTYLSSIEGNIYMRLRLQMLHTGKPLLNNIKVWANYTGYSVKTFVKALDVLQSTGHIIRLADGRLWNLDVEAELNDSVGKSEAASKAVSARWKKSKEKNVKCNTESIQHKYGNDTDSIRNEYESDTETIPYNINNNIYNKKTNTIVLAKKEIGSENLETNDLVQEPIEGDTLQSRPEQIEAGVENQPPIHEQENIPKKAKQAKANRGCRIPADFEPDYDFALTEGLPPERIKVEIAKFRDYWRSKAGANATKIDWQATWRNWVRNSKKYGINDNGGNNGNFSKDQRTRGGTGETIRNLIREAGFSESTSKHCTTDGAIRHKGVSMGLDQWREIDTSSRGTSFRNLSDSSKLTYLESVC
ncbi:YdaU family protein [Bartonella krasnovii]|uniref:YdaU family protein n=1 Tax=Bartonella krasnovii TaxID=2267275 RepID=A0ABY3W154_9HYPH|nr:YdaU family protein [Bartonella krasnovii]UNF29480.1 YdaU family protein [Bartonella krasnovii]UNF35838.1 YdaU family protein [Bartonella krasnovii]UNF37458.1 YdaU family protein [Bartonella krasnovii]UNF49024.1 YdaU family protein [Bartonella krasnovii]